MMKLGKVRFVFAFLGLALLSCGSNKTNAGNGSAAEETQAREIEALTLKFDVDKKYMDMPYKNHYEVTLQMDGSAKIHTEIHYPYGGEIGKPSPDDYQGSWALRQIKRGANYVDYYDIEFNNDERDLNWCVDAECKSLYFTWDGFENRNSNVENKINQVDTLYVE